MPRFPPLSLEAFAGGVARAFAGADPGWTRLRMASRVTVTLFLAALALAGSHLVAALPASAYAVALTLALQGAVAIRDATHVHRVQTRAICALAGFGVLAVVAVLTGMPAVVNMLFLAVAFVAVYARKWGPRWNAVGTFSFMSCFIGAYFRPAPADLGAIAFALVLAALVADWVRDRLIPDRPAADFRRTLSAVDQRIGAVVSLVRRGQRDGWTPNLRNAAVAAEQKVKDALIVAEGLLPTDGVEASGGPAPESAVSALSIKLFDIHLATETMLAAGFEAEAAGEAGRRRLMAALDRLAQVRRDTRQAAAGLTDAILDRSSGRAAKAGAAAPGAVWTDPSFRLATQVTLACALAMAGGLLVSEQRWFWAVLTAFLVFTNTQSRGDAALRGLNRAIGTAVGIVVGIGLATVFHDRFAVSLALIGASVFLGFYFLQLSYGALTFFVTIALSLLYGLLGNFSPGLLVLRLEETLIGAAAGVLVSFVVFPQRTGAATDKAADGFLAELDRLVAAFEGFARGEGSAWRLMAVTRVIDQRHGEIVAAIRPLDSGWLAGPRRRMVRRGLLRFTVLAYWAHMLAGATQTRPEGDVAADLETTLAACRAEIAEIRRRRSDFFHEARTVSLVPPDTASRRADLAGPDALLAIHAIRHVLNQVLATDGGYAATQERTTDRALSTLPGSSDIEPARFAGTMPRGGSDPDVRARRQP